MAELELPGPVLFDDFFEQTFSYSPNPKPHLRPWVGIFHHPPTQPAFWEPAQSLPAILDSAAFRESRPHLKLAICLSDHLAAWLQSRLDCPVASLKHPSEIPARRWTLASFAKQDPPRLVQAGWYLRNTRAIYQVPAMPDFERVRLLPRKSHILDYDRRLASELGLPPDQGQAPNCLELDAGVSAPVREIPFLSGDKYDRLFCNSVILTELLDASANNVVIECIARNTPIAINRHPAAVEYLGTDYPLYFDHLADVPGLLSWDNVLSAHRHLKRTNKRWLDGDHFAACVRKELLRVLSH